MLLSRTPGGEPEIFATIQGEGITVGVPSVFVRLGECNLKCTWCFVPETPVLMADWTWRSIGELRPSDEVIGIEQPTQRGHHVKLAAGTITRISRRHAATVLVNDTLRCTADHQFWLTGRDEAGRAGAAHSGWREVSRALGLKVLFTTDPVHHDDEAAYRRGWLAGMADGDGCFWTLRYRRGYRRFRLALNDTCLLERAEVFAADAGHALRRGVHKTTGFTEQRRTMPSLWLTEDAPARAFEAWLAEDVDCASWSAGYLGGILDAEGSHSSGVLRIAQHQVNEPTRKRIERALEALGLRFSAEEHGYYVRRARGQAWRALALARPAKRSLTRGAYGHHPHADRLIRSVVPTNQVDEVVTVTTTLGSFVAAGYVVKNCDTKYTWDWDHFDRDTQLADVTTAAVVDRVLALAGDSIRNVVITGGEPLLQQESAYELASQLRERGFRIEVETSGSIEPTTALATMIDQWNVSPKLEHSGNRKSARLRSGPLTFFSNAENANFKFVVVSPQDLDEVQAIASTFGVREDRILLMPEGTTAEALTTRSSWLVSECQARGFRFGTRLHVLLWGTERGR